MFKARAAEQIRWKKGSSTSPLPRPCRNHRRLCFLHHHHRRHLTLLDLSLQGHKKWEEAYSPPLPLQELQCPIGGCGQTRFFQVRDALNVMATTIKTNCRRMEYKSHQRLKGPNAVFPFQELIDVRASRCGKSIGICVSSRSQRHPRLRNAY